MIKKVAKYLVNCVVTVAVSLKSRVHAFGKFYYESNVLLYDDQNRNKFKLSFTFIVYLINHLDIPFLLKHVKLH